MEVDEADVGKTPSNNSGEDESDPTRRAEDGDAEGWIQVTYKRKGRASPNEETEQGIRSRSPTRRGGKSIVNKILRASKMPRLPTDEIKIIVRPRDGLNIRNTCRASLDEAIRHEAGVSSDEIVTICPNPIQNILVISTPDEKTATKFVKIKELTINGKKYETNAYVSAPEQMAKGIIRNIPLKYTQDQLVQALVNARNPSLAYAKRLGSTTTVILLYEGNRVPMWAYFNSIMMRVSLYRKQIDFCKECGRLGHRPDVCPRPEDKLCPACGAKNPAEDHECTPKCKLCGEAHPTADRTCRAKFKTPYLGQSSPPSTAVAAVSTPSTKIMEEEEEVEMVEEIAQQPGAKRKIPVTKTKERDGSEQEVKRPRPSTKKTDVLEDMINRLSDKMEKMFEMLVVQLSDSEAERKALALKHEKRLEELEKRI
ncbi:hypothetical protein MTO96_039543 [Rhipicephalus appendiculatus]